MANSKKNKKERVLSEKEQKRAERVAEITAGYESRGYQRKDIIVSITTANIMALVFVVIFTALMCTWYYRHNNNSFDFGNLSMLQAGLIFFLMIPVHEGLHGLTWGAFAPSHYKAIEFGVMKESLTPYCYCGEALSRGSYILGGFMPGLILGIIPSVIAVYTNSATLLTIGIFNFMGAGGDLMVIFKMLCYRAKGKSVVIMDHPTECGFIVFEK